MMTHINNSTLICLTSLRQMVNLYLASRVKSPWTWLLWTVSHWSYSQAPEKEKTRASITSTKKMVSGQCTMASLTNCLTCRLPLMFSLMTLILINCPITKMASSVSMLTQMSRMSLTRCTQMTRTIWLPIPSKSFMKVNFNLSSLRFGTDFRDLSRRRNTPSN